MRSGKLRHRVLIERFYQEKDEGGDFIKEWRQLATTWAAVEPLKDSDYWSALTVGTVTTHRVTMRGLGEACRPKPGTGSSCYRRTTAFCEWKASWTLRSGAMNWF